MHFHWNRLVFRRINVFSLFKIYKLATQRWAWDLLIGRRLYGGKYFLVLLYQAN